MSFLPLSEHVESALLAAPDPQGSIYASDPVTSDDEKLYQEASDAVEALNEWAVADFQRVKNLLRGRGDEAMRIQQVVQHRAQAKPLARSEALKAVGLLLNHKTHVQQRQYRARHLLENAIEPTTRAVLVQFHSFLGFSDPRQLTLGGRLDLVSTDVDWHGLEKLRTILDASIDENSTVVQANRGLVERAVYHDLEAFFWKTQNLPGDQEKRQHQTYLRDQAILALAGAEARFNLRQLGVRDIEEWAIDQVAKFEIQLLSRQGQAPQTYDAMKKVSTDVLLQAARTSLNKPFRTHDSEMMVQETFIDMFEAAIQLEGADIEYVITGDPRHLQHVDERITRVTQSLLGKDEELTSKSKEHALALFAEKVIDLLEEAGIEGGLTAEDRMTLRLIKHQRSEIDYLRADLKLAEVRLSRASDCWDRAKEALARAEAELEGHEPKTGIREFFSRLLIPEDKAAKKRLQAQISDLTQSFEATIAPLEKSDKEVAELQAAIAQRQTGLNGLLKKSTPQVLRDVKREVRSHVETKGRDFSEFMDELAEATLRSNGVNDPAKFLATKFILTAKQSVASQAVAIVEAFDGNEVDAPQPGDIAERLVSTAADVVRNHWGGLSSAMTTPDTSVNFGQFITTANPTLGAHFADLESTDRTQAETAVYYLTMAAAEEFYGRPALAEPHRIQAATAIAELVESEVSLRVNGRPGPGEVGL